MTAARRSKIDGTVESLAALARNSSPEVVAYVEEAIRAGAAINPSELRARLKSKGRPGRRADRP